MLSIFYKKIKDKKTVVLEKPKPGSWINLVNPSQEEIEFLKTLGVNPLFIRDALDPDELPRIEKEKRFVYIILNFPQRENEKIFNIPVLIVISKNYFITLSQRNLDCFENIINNATTQKVKNLIRICLQATNLYTWEIRRINKEINSKKVSLSKLKNRDISAFVELEEGLNEFITANVAQIGVFEKIHSGKFLGIFSGDEELLETLIIDSRQSLDMSQTSIKKIVNIRESYSAILSNNLNKTMKLLTSLAFILGIPTIIGSFYGMNVILPFQTNPFAFFYIIASTLIICLILITIFFLKKWL